jgi:hypothetical protein
MNYYHLYPTDDQAFEHRKCNDGLCPCDPEQMFLPESDSIMVIHSPMDGIPWKPKQSQIDEARRRILLKEFA